VGWIGLGVLAGRRKDLPRPCEPDLSADDYPVHAAYAASHSSRPMIRNVQVHDPPMAIHAAPQTIS
jgi:hypothetical protein